MPQVAGRLPPLAVACRRLPCRALPIFDAAARNFAAIAGAMASPKDTIALIAHANCGKRGDVHIEEVVMPPEQLGELADEFTPLERVFSLRLIWRDGEDFPPDFNPRAAAQTQAETG